MKFTNFKSWAQADIICAPITGIFGTNSSGKTSIIQLLLLLKQTKDATDRATALALNGDLVQLGTMRDAIHRHEEQRALEVSLSFMLRQPLSLADPSGKGSSLVASGNILNVEAKVGIENRAPVARSLSYGLGRKIFKLAPRNGDQSKFDLTVAPTDGESSSFEFVRTRGRPWQLPGPVKTFAFPDQARTFFQNAGFLADLEAAYERQLGNLFYLGPLREYPKRDYLWARSRPADVGLRGEKVIDAILAATEAGEVRNLSRKTRLKPFQEMIAHWLREMGLIDDFRVEEIKEGSSRWQAKVKTRPGASEVLLTDVGFGVSQVLPVITLLQYVPEGSTVVLEQPEIHLHPLAQAGLADVIIQAATHRHVQVILESHSEHLLLRLQRRIAENELNSDSVKIYFADAPRGVSNLIPLAIDLFGQIKNWPDKFMGDAFGETAGAELARLKRMQAAE